MSTPSADRGRPRPRHARVPDPAAGRRRQSSSATPPLASGDLAVRVAGEETTEALDRHGGRPRRAGAVVVSAEGELAPGLVVTRAGSGSATACAEPAPEQWFTGVGAAADHASTLELVNPDRRTGGRRRDRLRTARRRRRPALRGLRVPGGGQRPSTSPTWCRSRDELALQVVGLARPARCERGRRGRPGRTRRPPGLAAVPDRSRPVVVPRRAGDRTDRPGPAASSPSPTRATARSASSSGWSAGQRVRARRRSRSCAWHRIGAGDRPRPGPARSGGRGRAGLLLDATAPVTATLRTRVATTWHSRPPVRASTRSRRRAAGGGRAHRAGRGDRRGVVDRRGLGRRRQGSGRTSDGSRSSRRRPPGRGCPPAPSWRLVTARAHVGRRSVEVADRGAVGVPLRPARHDGLVPAVRPALP